MEKLAGLQHLVNAPKLSVANKIINLVFDRRSTGFTEEEEAQISKILGGLSPEDTESLLIAIRLLIKIALRKNVELSQIPQAFPESVDKRLHPIILKILAAHIDDWRQEVAQDKAAAAAAASSAAAAEEKKEEEPAAPQEEEPKQEKEQSLPPLPQSETENVQANSTPKKKKQPKKSEEPSLPPPPPPPAAEPEPEPVTSSLPPPPPPTSPLKSEKVNDDDAAAAAAAAAEAERIKLKKKKRAAAAAAAAQQQQQQQQQQLSGPSLPRLQGFDWRVDVRSASDSVARMAVPSVIVQMEVQKQRMGKPSVVGNGEEEENGNRVVTFELNRETLETMLDGLIFVRDQLASIAAK